MPELTPTTSPPTPRVPWDNARRRRMRIHLLALDIAALLVWMLAGAAPTLMAVPPLVHLVLVAIVAGAFLSFAFEPRTAEPTRRLRFRMTPPMPGSWATTAAAVVLLPVGLVALLLLVHPHAADRPAPTAGNWAALASPLLLAPLVEEALFRGSIQQRLERQLGPHAGIAATSILFALIHLDSAALLPHLLAALVFGYAAWTTASIWPAVAIHLAANLGIALLVPAAPATLEPGVWLAIALTCAGGLALLYAGASRRVPERPTYTRIYHRPDDAPVRGG